MKDDNYIRDVDGGFLCQCGNCNWRGKELELGCDLDLIPDINERLDPGGEVPVGECPECHSLAYVVKREEARAVLPSHVELIAAVKQDIAAISNIYRSVGSALYDEPAQRLAERIVSTVERLTKIL